MRTAVRRLQNISLLLVTLFLFFGGIETFLRASGLVKMRDYTPPIYEHNENPKISYTLKPNIREKAFRNWVTTDENGFRASLDTSLLERGMSSRVDAYRGRRPSSVVSRDMPRSRYGTTPSFAKASEGTRDDSIVILGDSITFGYGVRDEETLPAKLQELLPNATVINAGVPGYHVGQEIAFYKEKLAPLDPDVLVLVFYWNDEDMRTSWLDDSGVMRADGWKPSEQICQPIEQGILGLLPGRCWLDLNSAFYRAVKEYVNTRAAIYERDVRRTGEQKQFSVDTGMNLTRYGEKLRELARMAPERRLFVIWPDESFHENTRPAIKTLAERNGFVVVDLYNDFGNAMETLDWDYIHPSTKSLSDAASVIYDALKKFLP